MGLFGSSDPTVKQEKLINKEAKNDEKALKSAIKDVQNTEKEERSALKHKGAATEAYEKAMKAEQKLREELTKLTAKHEAAVSHMKAMEKEVQSKTEAHQRAYDLSHKTKADLETLQKENQGHEAERQRRLNQLHGTVAATAGGDGVLRDINGNPAHGPDARGISPQPSTEGHSNVAPVAAGTAVGAGAGVAGGEALAHHNAAPAAHTDAASQAPVAAQAAPQQQAPVTTQAQAPQTTQNFVSPTSTTGSAGNFQPPPSHPSTATEPSAAGAGVQAAPIQTSAPVNAVPQHETNLSPLGAVQQPQHGQTTTDGHAVAEAVKSM